MNRCEVSTAGMQCTLDAGHRGWHVWTNTAPTEYGDDVVEVSWSWSPTRITQLPEPWLKRAKRWLDVPVFSRWWTLVIWTAVGNAAIEIVRWFR